MIQHPFGTTKEHIWRVPGHGLKFYQDYIGTYPELEVWVKYNCRPWGTALCKPQPSGLVHVVDQHPLRNNKILKIIEHRPGAEPGRHPWHLPRIVRSEKTIGELLADFAKDFKDFWGG